MTEERISVAHPLAWLFHANTMRWAHNAEPPPEDAWPMDPRETPGLPLIRFPPSPAPIELEGLLQRRCSCRVFKEAPVALSTIGALLRDGYGILATDRDNRLEFPLRPVPSGGGLYPLELTLIARRIEGLAPGVYHYVAEHHGLEQVTEADFPKVLLDYLFMGQASLTAAPALLVLSAVWKRSMTKYGDRGYRYMLFEAGHVMQNINLSAARRGLGSCNIGGFFDVELGEILQLDRDIETPLYACAVGFPATENRMEQRDIG